MKMLRLSFLKLKQLKPLLSLRLKHFRFRYFFNENPTALTISGLRDFLLVCLQWKGYLIYKVRDILPQLGMGVILCPNFFINN